MSRVSRGCSVEGCEGPHYARGWCKRCYYRWRHHGFPGYLREPGWWRSPTPELPIHPGNPWWKPNNEPCPGCGSNLWRLPYDPLRDDTIWHCVDCGDWSYPVAKAA